MVTRLFRAPARLLRFSEPADFFLLASLGVLAVFMEAEITLSIVEAMLLSPSVRSPGWACLRDKFRLAVVSVVRVLRRDLAFDCLLPEAVVCESSMVMSFLRRF